MQIEVVTFGDRLNPLGVIRNPRVHPRPVTFGTSIPPGDESRELDPSVLFANQRSSGVAPASVDAAAQPPGAHHRIQDGLLPAPVHPIPPAGLQR